MEFKEVAGCFLTYPLEQNHDATAEPHGVRGFGRRHRGAGGGANGSELWNIH